jgi:hypothetical protein
MVRAKPVGFTTARDEGIAKSSALTSFSAHLQLEIRPPGASEHARLGCGYVE